MSYHNTIKEVLRYWGIDFSEVMSDAMAPGSPERCLERWVVADTGGNRFILERLDNTVFERKTAIARRMERLSDHGLTVTPYCRQLNGQWLLKDDCFCWQVAPFVEGAVLDRERYWEEGWRGKAIGRWLIQLAEATRDWDMDEAPFSLPGYIDDLVNRISRHNPEHLPEVAPIHDFLRRQFYPVIDRIPLGFCHGDPHPVNTIWGPNRILSVIDWEFCGWKPILYDAALIVGCVGAEAPGARNAGFIDDFLKTLRDSYFFSDDIMALLPLMVLAVRFGWLSEWLRRNDKEMIDFEVSYMGLIIAS